MSSTQKHFSTRICGETKVQNKTSKKLSAAHSSHPRDTVTIGAAPVTTMKAVTSTSRNLNASSSRNRTCTGLFVSRLEPHYTAKHIGAFIWQQAGEKVRVEEITGRASLHSSFYVPCDRPVRDALKNSNIWPTGCFVKLYFS